MKLANRIIASGKTLEIPYDFKVLDKIEKGASDKLQINANFEKQVIKIKSLENE